MKPLPDATTALEASGFAPSAEGLVLEMLVRLEDIRLGLMELIMTATSSLGIYTFWVVTIRISP